MRRWKGWVFCAVWGGTVLAVLLCGDRVRLAAAEGLRLCVRALIPSLFPLSVLTNLLLYLGYGAKLGAIASPLTRRLTGSAGVGTALILGLIGGYPLGAQALGTLVEQKALERQTAERFLGCCNNAGPAFIIGAVGLGLFQSFRLGLLLYLIHVGAALFACRVLRPAASVSEPAILAVPAEPLHRAFPHAVAQASLGMLRICGFVVFFTVLLSLPGELPPVRTLAARLPPVLIACGKGLMELSCGIFALRGCPAKAAFPAAAGLLAWGGICVRFQALSAAADSGLQGRTYWRGKALQTLFSVAAALAVQYWAV